MSGKRGAGFYSNFLVQTPAKVCRRSGCGLEPVEEELCGAHLQETLQARAIALSVMARRARADRRHSLGPIAHGTAGGYQAEKRRGVKHCDACTEANTRAAQQRGRKAS